MEKWGRYGTLTVGSGTGESFVNTAEWPRPSKGSLKEQRHVGPGGEKLDRLGNLTVKVSTEQHGGNDILS